MCDDRPASENAQFLSPVSRLTTVGLIQRASRRKPRRIIDQARCPREAEAGTATGATGGGASSSLSVAANS